MSTCTLLTIKNSNVTLLQLCKQQSGACILGSVYFLQHVYNPLACVEKRGGVIFFCIFFGKPGSSRPMPDPISAWLHRHHPSLSLLPLCGHTKTLFVLPLLALLQTYHHPNAQPRGGWRRDEIKGMTEEGSGERQERMTVENIRWHQGVTVEVSGKHNITISSLNVASRASLANPPPQKKARVLRQKQLSVKDEQRTEHSSFTAHKQVCGEKHDHTHTPWTQIN